VTTQQPINNITTRFIAICASQNSDWGAQKVYKQIIADIGTVEILPWRLFLGCVSSASRERRGCLWLTAGANEKHVLTVLAYLSCLEAPRWSAVIHS